MGFHPSESLTCVLAPCLSNILIQSNDLDYRWDNLVANNKGEFPC